MAVIRRHWGWRTWTMVAGLSILAGLAGISSELMAGATVSKFTFKGPELYAEWDLSSATTSTGAWVFTQSGVTGPGTPQPATATEIYADQFNRVTNQEYTFWNTGTLGPNDTLTVDPNLNSGSTSIAALAGTLQLWDWNAGTLNTVPATASASASLPGPPEYTEHDKSSSRQFSQSANIDTRSYSDQMTGWYLPGTGSVSLVDANGNTYPTVAPGTAVTVSYVADVKSGQRSVKH
jgi:hypothetical protein